MGGFPKTWSTLLGFPILKVIIFLGLYWNTQVFLRGIRGLHDAGIRRFVFWVLDEVTCTVRL